jgi:Lecithin:cholesterol acyltransferase
MSRQPMPDVIVLLPGILGSVLTKDGKDVWAPSAGAVLGGIMSLGDNVKALALDGDDPTVDDLGDGVAATQLAPDVHLIPYVWKIDGYSKVQAAITQFFDVREGQNFFTFPYDWRRDNRVAARKLAAQSQRWLADWRQSSGNADAKLILIAHSMGGLVSRYFIEVLGGWRDTRALLTFGTPYRGSLNALQTLVEGVRKGPFGMVDLSAFVRSLTSMYQLLPIYPCYDLGTGRLERIGETSGIPNVDAERARAALAFHREIRDAVTRNVQDATDSTERYRISPIVGIEQPTLQSARNGGSKVEFLGSHDGRDDRGDGTVPRVSAAPIELGADGAMYAGDRHASLQNADPVLIQLKGFITNLYLPLGQFRAPLPTRAQLGLDLEDAYWSDQDVTFTLRSSRAGNQPIRAVIENCANGERRGAASLVIGVNGPASTRLKPLEPGVYRLRVSGDDTVDPVSDLFTVFDRATA